MAKAKLCNGQDIFLQKSVGRSRSPGRYASKGDGWGKGGKRGGKGSRDYDDYRHFSSKGLGRGDKGGGKGRKGYDSDRYGGKGKGRMGDFKKGKGKGKGKKRRDRDSGPAVTGDALDNALDDYFGVKRAKVDKVDNTAKDGPASKSLDDALDKYMANKEEPVKTDKTNDKADKSKLEPVNTDKSKSDGILKDERETEEQDEKAK